MIYERGMNAPSMAGDVLGKTVEQLMTFGSDVQASVLGAVESSLLLPAADVVPFAIELDAEAPRDPDLTSGFVDDVPEPLLPVGNWFAAASGDPRLANWRLREAIAARLAVKNYADSLRRQTDSGEYVLDRRQHAAQLSTAELMARRIIRRVLIAA